MGWRVSGWLARKPATEREEGGAGSGDITFFRKDIGKALEYLKSELDPGWMPAPQLASGSVVQLSL